jgi:copper resistance protein D
MEHSVLHGLELAGQIIALGGALFVLCLVGPARRALGRGPGLKQVTGLVTGAAARWLAWGALGAAVATGLNLLVEAEETQNRTVFGGIDLGLVARFALGTRVGRMSLERIGVLVLTAAAARWGGRGKWWLALGGTLGGIVLTSLVSHAAAQPDGRAVMLVSQVAHVVAAATWLGVLVHLLVARPLLSERGGSAGLNLLAGIVQRFSLVALTVTSLLGVSGLWMICRFLAEPAAVITSTYGLTLIVKVLLVAPAIYAGLINFRMIRPALLRLSQRGRVEAWSGQEESNKETVLRRFGRMLELEVTAGLLLITVAGILASVSPPGEAGDYRLSKAQAVALLRPHLPVVRISNPAGFLGAPERTLADRRYAEFTHNWSGVMVGLMGLGWLLQNARGRVGKWARKLWPLLLLPFAVFVAVAADPEVWLFRQVSVGEVLRDPQMLEHQLGAVMILILAWLGWRNNARPEGSRSFGYGLSIVLAAGGILLLGHAHSTLNSAEELTNLINVQHAVFGFFIVLAGTVQWLVLRGLFPRRSGNVIWPSLVIGLGLFMAFCYRETGYEALPSDAQEAKMMTGGATVDSLESGSANSPASAMAARLPAP